ncbi:ACP S-malonyltransferase, partial [bacterium]|nr:ACP S-malonyltransferase [bacterium]
FLDVYNNSESAKAVFDKADEVLNRKISTLCFEGPDEDLKLTTNTQPAILTTSIALLEAFKAVSGITPDYVAGHSLGEYAALYESDVLTMADTFRLIQKRADAMSKAQGGSMAAVLALSNEKVQEVLKEVKSGYVDVANYNCPGQVVITGDEPAIKEAAELLSAAGAKRVLPLAVSGAFHSEKMRRASEEFACSLEDVNINDAKIPVITNVDAEPTTTGFKDKMVAQIYSSVYWTQSVEKMIELGVDTFVEIGNGKVLAGLIKKISAEVKVYNVYNSETIEEVSKLVKGE